MPYPIGVSPHHPTPLPERGCSVVPAWSLTPGSFLPLDKSCVNPTLLLSLVPTNWHLQRGAWNCSEWSAKKEKGSTSYQAIVPQCLGETLAVTPRCLPPALWVVCSWKVPRWGFKQQGMAQLFTSPSATKMAYQMLKVILMVLLCLESNWVHLSV